MARDIQRGVSIAWIEGKGDAAVPNVSHQFGRLLSTTVEAPLSPMGEVLPW